MSPPSLLPTRPGGRKLWVFRALTVGAIGVFGVLVAEYGLRWRQAVISRSDALEPGMVHYDAELGWQLAPGWTGQHRHHDFAARYSVNALGFRADTPFLPENGAGRPTVVAGDSFTFGLGVNDDETFVHRLNASQNGGGPFVNGAIPGYSTDQEALLMEKRILGLHPERILLVIYVGNDLLDNMLPVPMQVGSQKPYFEVTDRGLLLRNSPVPLERATGRSAQRGLLTMVLGSDSTQWALKVRLEQHSELFRIFSQSWLPEKDYAGEFGERFAPAVRLFDRLMDRIAEVCARERVQLTVAMVAGRSFFATPGSVSAQYQDHFLQQVAKTCGGKGLTTIDLANLMRPRYAREGGNWFFPNEGHLSASGHRVVAEILARELRRGQETRTR